MALPILDGNQTSTTLATTVSGGAHYPNHILASAVTISSMPAISGTVTANNNIIDNYFSSTIEEVGTSDASLAVRVQGSSASPIPISGTVTANVLGFDDQSGLYEPIPVGLATNGFAPNEYAVKALIGTEAGGLSSANPLPISGTVTANLFSVPTHGVTIANSSVTVNGTFYQATQPVSLASLPSLAAGTAQIGSVTASISGTVPVSISSVTIGNTVTVSALPSGALTTRFGSVTTANTAQITTAVTNNSRKYLLAQNISAGTVTIGIGFSPTTTQGIQLSAGGGISFDSFCPTGAVWWLGATTGATFTILEG